jgi:hypothetical protein
MAAPKGNKFGTKLKEPEARQEAFKQYCQHIAEGWPKEAFFFSHPEYSVCHKTMERYIAESPEEFPSHLLNDAKSKRYKHWIEEGKTLMKGGYRHGSPSVWQTIMRNIFRDIGWDKDTSSSNFVSEEFLKPFAAIMSQLGKLQSESERKIADNNNNNEQKSE